MSAAPQFVDWARDYFSSLSGHLDADVLSEYVCAVLEDLDASDGNLHSEVTNLLSAYLPDDVCKTASTALIDAFRDHQAVAGTGGGRTDQHDHDDIITMEERMRSMMRADCAKVVPDVPSPSKNRRERDHCTSACLREAGVAGYQGDSEDEKDVEIAITNAEFRAKQRLDATSGQGLLGDGVSELVLAESPDSEIDLEQLEDVSGYGKKTDVKPGTVEDALSVLNPSLFGPTCSVAARAFPVGVARLPTPGSRSNPSGTFRLPTTNAANTDATKATLLEIPSEPEGARNRRTERKKKISLPSKHITKVAAQAEAKAKQAKLSGAQAHGALNAGPIRARQDEMDAFLFSDPESDENEVITDLPKGGENRAKVKEAEVLERQKSAAAAAQRRAQEKASREKQLQQAIERKQAAQKKTQKVERRR